MSNPSIQLGGGKWATKVGGSEGNALAFSKADNSDKHLAYEFGFDRPTNFAATKINKQGLIQKYRENDITHSNNFSDSAWIKDRTAVSGNQLGYDGTNDAWKFEATVAAVYPASQNIRQNVTSTNTKYVWSGYFKAATAKWIRLNMSGSGQAYFDLQNGAVGRFSAGMDAHIEAVGNGWYRCSIANTTTVNPFNSVYVYLAHKNGTDADPNLGLNVAVGEYVLMQDLQLELGSAPSAPITSTATKAETGPVEDEPRIDYKNGHPELLLEPSRQNLIAVSETSVAGQNSTILERLYGIAPDGTRSSLKVTKTGSGGANCRIMPATSNSLTLRQGEDYTVSAFVKNVDNATGSVTTIGSRMEDGTLFRESYMWDGDKLKRANPLVHNSGTRTARIWEDYGNGWYRIGFSFSPNDTKGGMEVDIDRENGSSTTSIESWGWQFEEGVDSIGSGEEEQASFATSYIPTYGAAATRRWDNIKQFDATSLTHETDIGIFFEGSAFAHTFKGISSGSAVGRFYNLFPDGDDDGTDRILLYSRLTTESTFSLVAQQRVSQSAKQRETTTRFPVNGNNTQGSMHIGDNFRSLQHFDGTKQRFFVNGEQIQDAQTITAVRYFDDIALAKTNESLGHRVRDFRVYPKPLTINDAEVLTGLTEYASFANMANGFNYTIEE